MKGWLTENLLLKLIALLLTLVLHLVVNEDRDEAEVFFVKVNTTLPSDQVMMGDVVDRLSVSIRGKRSTLNRFKTEPLPPVEVDVRDAEDGVYPFSPELITLPPGLEIVSINPPSMQVVLDKREQRFAAVVVPPLIGAPMQGHRIVSRSIEPEKVEAIGPASRLEGVFAITEQVSINGRTDTLIKELRLRDTSGRGVEFKPNKVKLTVRIEPIEVERLFEHLPIEVRDTRYEVTIDPPVVNVTLMGTPDDLENLDGQAITPVLDASGIDSKPAGRWKKKVEIDNLPPGIEVKHVSPAYVSLTTFEAIPGPEPDKEREERDQ